MSYEAVSTVSIQRRRLTQRGKVTDHRRDDALQDGTQDIEDVAQQPQDEEGQRQTLCRLSAELSSNQISKAISISLEGRLLTFSMICGVNTTSQQAMDTDLSRQGTSLAPSPITNSTEQTRLNRQTLRYESGIKRHLTQDRSIAALLLLS